MSLNPNVGCLHQLPENNRRIYENGRRLKGLPPKIGVSDLPTVTVITVVYNNALTLKRCIDSVVAQSYPNIEYIVIDGGSTDGTLDVIKAHISEIDYAVSEPDGGIYDAMNKGISLISGDYVALINSDDWLEPNGIELSMDNLLSNRAEISLGHVNVWTRDNTFSHVWTIGNFDTRILTSGMSFCHQGVVASKRAYQSTPAYDTSIKISSDYKWIKGLFLTELKTVFTETPVANFSFDGVSANNRPIWKEECKQMLCEQFPFLDYKDISAFLEYVYRDKGLDPHAVTNLVMNAGSSPLLLQSLALVLMDKLMKHELAAKNVVPNAAKVAPKPHNRGALSLSEQVDSTPSSVSASGHQATRAPKISVVIPVYNVEDYLEDCLRSVMTQSLRDIEIICVNDGSPDNSQAILERLAQEDSRIKIIQKENGGLSSARNAGIKAALGEYIHFLDSDDYINPGMYQRMYDYAAQNELELVKSNLGFIDDVYPTKRPFLPAKEFFVFDDCPQYAQFISPCAALYHTDLLSRVSGFPEGLTYEDRPFNWETIVEAKRIGHIDEIFYMYRVARPGSIMSTRTASAKHFDAFSAIDVLNKYLLSSGNLEKYRLEYVKEQLRVYSMLVDINAIPRAMYGRFYWECHKRLNAHPVSLAEIEATELPPRVKALYAFFLDAAVDANAVQEGERYFFHGLPYKETSKAYSGSSCELFLIAKAWIREQYDSVWKSDVQRFKEAALISMIFHHVHGSNNRPLDQILRDLKTLHKLLEENASFVQLIDYLHDPARQRGAGQYRNIGFLYSKARNYLNARDFIQGYLAKREVASQFFTHDDIGQPELPDAIKLCLKRCIDDIRAAGVRPHVFSEQVEMCAYMSSHVDLSKVNTLSVLFPYSAAERYLIELLDGRCKTIFVPHGLPQISFHNDRFDYVLSLTMGQEWADCYPNARVVHLGCPELLQAEKKADAFRNPAKAGPKRVLFLSQLSGGTLHRLDDFVDLSNAFLKQCLALDPRKYQITLRLRHGKEVDLLDRNLVAQAKSSQHVAFSTLSEPLENCQTDLLVSATSTGLLYAQPLEVPSLQVTTHRLQQHWPFQLVRDENRYYCDGSNEPLGDVFERACKTSKPKKLYQRPTSELAEAALDIIYARSRSTIGE